MITLLRSARNVTIIVILALVTEIIVLAANIRRISCTNRVSSKSVATSRQREKIGDLKCHRQTLEAVQIHLTKILQKK